MPKFTANLNLPKYSSAPSSPTDGDVYYNTTDHKVYSRINGAWVDLGATAAAGSGIPDTIIDAKGDLIVGSSADTPIRLGVGTDGQILAANGSVTGGIEWIDNVAEETRLLIKNETGSTLTKGQVVYINGASGNLPTVALSQANAESTSSKTVGVVRQTITNNSSGYITLSGLLKNVDTQGFTAGQAVWLSATTAGAITATRPTTPNHAVLIGFIPKVDANGEIFVLIQNGFELDELHNVLLTSPASGEWLKYDGTKWVNATLPSASTSAAGIVQLSDSTSTTSSALAATATAAKAAYDRGSQGITDAASALSAANSKVASVTAGSSRVTVGGTATNPTVDVAAASTTVAGIVSLTDSTATTSSTIAATATAVKAAKDAADSAQATANAAVPTTRTLTGTAPITIGGVSGTGQDLSANRTIAVTSASTSSSGVVQLSDSTNTTSSTLAATPTAVKSAYDLASTANTTAGAAIPKSTVTTAGDLIVASGAATVTRLGAGTANNGKYLSVVSGSPAWTTITASGATVYYRTTDPTFPVGSGGLGVTPNAGDVWVDSDDNTQPVTFDVEIYPTFLLMGA